MQTVHSFDCLLSYAPWILYCSEKWLPIRYINHIGFLFGIFYVLHSEPPLHKCLSKLSRWFHPSHYALHSFDNKLLSRHEEHNAHVNQRKNIYTCNNRTRVDCWKYSLFIYSFNLWNLSDFKRLEKRKDNLEIKWKKSDWIIIRKYQYL